VGDVDGLDRRVAGHWPDDYFYRNPNYLVMASNAVIALALNQVDVQRIFQIRIEQDDRRT